MRVWPVIKTGVLAILVGTSLVLTEELWAGGWGGSGEISYSAEPSLPHASVPAEADVTSPCQIVLSNGNPQVAAIFMPGTGDYKDWIGRLGAAHIYSLHTGQVPVNSFVRSVEFDFGVNLNYADLIRWVPGLQPSVLPKQAQTVYLYQTQSGGPVMLGLVSDSGSYIAQTDLQAAQFASLFHHAILLDPWEVWNRQVGSFVPKTSFDMFDVTIALNSRSVVPLVHSFFVNPQALTSVPESQHTILWTDGSRAVWWDQTKRTLTYADPNIPGRTGVSTMGVPDILSYIESHGGAQTNSLLSQSTSVTGTNIDWTLQPYVYGFPLLNSSQSIQLATVGSHIASYQSPVDTWSIEDRSLVHIIDAAQLGQILHQLMPSTSTNELSVQLGYVMENIDSHTGELIPAYVISQSGMQLWEIDAVTGKVLKGMKVS
ncbi:hypothetical protein [Alicyclobacillus ferrooxydans]|uniref:Uncharacterized protein n=1 Tax=Alicyclobacillus ferrooxydans TaxID=471514 RepID=A0A0P9CHF7_9BACL|nr:hypothetical protein [Alicyclobacillus ferrooxydans]KPV42487.1 hypothetical protein AN477_17165 [Alicyclobacillus ferrooxydans]